MADPLACLNVMSYSPADGLGWHFDRAEFTVTLLLRAAGAGGAVPVSPQSTERR